MLTKMYILHYLIYLQCETEPNNYLVVITHKNKNLLISKNIL